MQDLFSSPTGIKWQGDVGIVEYQNDNSMVVLFLNKPIPNAAKSKEMGRPVFENITHVRVHPPGERLNIVERPITENDKRRWPVQWAQFQQQAEQIPEGVPIDLLYPHRPDIAAGLRASGVHTIEQCANLSGTAIDALGMGSQQYCNDAKRYLEVANKGVGAAQFKQELDARDDKIRTLTRQVEELTDQIKSMKVGETTQALDLKQIQALIAGAMQQPTYPNTPQGNVAGVFDPQSAMIAATHPSLDEATTKKRGRPKKV